MDRQKVYVDNYKSMKTWAATKLNIPRELAEDIVHTFYIKWMKANIEDRNVALYPLLWKAFKNSAYTFLLQESQARLKSEVYKTAPYEMGPDVYVHPKLAFEQYCKLLSESDKQLLLAMIIDESLVDVANKLNLNYSSIKNRKSSKLRPLFEKVFLGE
jgi:DNA-directed RNA polymerase specialized sigma24 family protein